MSAITSGRAMIAAALILAGSVAAADADPAAGPAYRLSRTIALGVPDRWDYLAYDPVRNRVFVSHGDTISVADADSGALVGRIEGVGGTTHGIAFAQDLGKGYTDDGKSGTAVSFDLKSLKVIHRIKAEPDADGIVFDPASGHIFVIDGDSAKLTVIDPRSDGVVATIETGGGLEFGVSDAHGKLYVNGVEKNEIVRVDTRTNQVDAHWPMPGCLSPHGLAMDRRGAILFSSCANKVMAIIDARNGAQIALLPIGEGTDFAEFDARRSLAFSSNREGTISVIAERSAARFVALPPIETQPGARTMAIDQKSGRIFSVTADMTTAPTAAAVGVRRHYEVVPGSARLLMFDPVAR